MPYIPKTMRERLKKSPPGTPGELNYLVTLQILATHNDEQTLDSFVEAVEGVIAAYVAENTPLRYQVVNDVIGALRCAGGEYVRRKWNSDHTILNRLEEVAGDFYIDTAAPYEDAKRDENGDVY